MVLDNENDPYSKLRMQNNHIFGAPIMQEHYDLKREGA